MRWLFTSDLHGQQALYEQVVALAAAERPHAVVLGGDLGPHGAGASGIERQRLFLEGFFVEFARRLAESAPDARLLVLMGNDDWAANHDVLDRHDGGLWSVLHERVVDVHGVAVAGVSWVPITPFALKDWDRWEDGGEESPPRLDGITSRGGRPAPLVLDPAQRTPTIAAALDDLAARAPAGAIVVAHTPPLGTGCDWIHARRQVGSRALRAFVEARQPPLLLSGHIHESPRVSGAWRDRLGDTLVVNPGQFGTPRLCAVRFDPERPGDTIEHTVHARD